MLTGGSRWEGYRCIVAQRKVQEESAYIWNDVCRRKSWKTITRQHPWLERSGRLQSDADEADANAAAGVHAEGDGQYLSLGTSKRHTTVMTRMTRTDHEVCPHMNVGVPLVLASSTASMSLIQYIRALLLFTTACCAVISAITPLFLSHGCHEAWFTTWMACAALSMPLCPKRPARDWEMLPGGWTAAWPRGWWPKGSFEKLELQIVFPTWCLYWHARALGILPLHTCLSVRFFFLCFVLCLCVCVCVGLFLSFFLVYLLAYVFFCAPAGSDAATSACACGSLYIYPSTYRLPICLLVCLSISLARKLSIYLSTYVSVYLSI